jgi:hypothetical protein
MSDASSHETAHAAGAPAGGHIPADPNDAVLRAKAPSPRALLCAAVAAVLTTAGLLAVAVASARGA